MLNALQVVDLLESASLVSGKTRRGGIYKTGSVPIALRVAIDQAGPSGIRSHALATMLGRKARAIGTQLQRLMDRGAIVRANRGLYIAARYAGAST